MASKRPLTTQATGVGGLEPKSCGVGHVTFNHALELVDPVRCRPPRMCGVADTPSCLLQPRRWNSAILVGTVAMVSMKGNWITTSVQKLEVRCPSRHLFLVIGTSPEAISRPVLLGRLPVMPGWLPDQDCIPSFARQRFLHDPSSPQQKHGGWVWKSASQRKYEPLILLSRHCNIVPHPCASAWLPLPLPLSFTIVLAKQIFTHPITTCGRSSSTPQLSIWFAVSCTIAVHAAVGAASSILPEGPATTA